MIYDKSLKSQERINFMIVVLDHFYGILLSLELHELLDVTLLIILNLLSQVTLIDLFLPLQRSEFDPDCHTECLPIYLQMSSQVDFRGRRLGFAYMIQPHLSIDPIVHLYVMIIAQVHLSVYFEKVTIQLNLGTHDGQSEMN